MLTWGDRHIPDTVDAVANIFFISYDQKKNSIMQRMTKKIRITLDHSILVITEENLINTTNAWKYKILGVGKALSNATLDRAKRDEKELVAALKELEHLCHLDEYYKGTMNTTVYLTGEFEEVYKKFKKEQHVLIVKIVEL
jgi:hypothetical protein